MSDYQQQPPQPYPPQPVTQYQPGPPAPPAPPKKKTGLIIAIVVIALLLLCCCGAGVGGYLLYLSSDGTSSSTASDTPAAVEEPDPEEEARLAEWQKVQDAFVKHDFEFAEPDERMNRLAPAAMSELLPDFTVEEFKVEHGEYNEAEGWHLWDHCFFRLSLKADPDVQTAFACYIHTAEGDARNSARDQIDVEEDEDAFQLEGRTWVIHPADSKIPLVRGIKDDSYVGLMRKAMDDFPGGLPTQLLDQEDGSVVVHVETWDSYCWSWTYDRIEATYERDGSDWTLGDYKAVLEPKEDTSDGTEI